VIGNKAVKEYVKKYGNIGEGSKKRLKRRTGKEI
jgi:hypothetical protein